MRSSSGFVAFVMAHGVRRRPTRAFRVCSAARGSNNGNEDEEKCAGCHLAHDGEKDTSTEPASNVLGAWQQVAATNANC